MEDLDAVEHVEINVNPDGRVWVNINGKCALRIALAKHITVERAGHKMFRIDQDIITDHTK